MFDLSRPHSLPELPPDLDMMKYPKVMSFLKLHNEALKEVSELNGALRQIDNPNLLLSTFYLKESISSNAVEHIYTTIESALKDDTKPEEERSTENKEVINYRSAIVAGAESYELYGLSSRTIKVIHKQLKVKKGVPGTTAALKHAVAGTSLASSEATPLGWFQTDP